MTTEVNLNLIWSSTGGAVNPGDVKYQTGWVVEIPTFEHFNFVLQNLSTNQLALAEKGSYNWHVSIAYVAGSTVIEAGLKYTCITSHTGQQPSLDATRSYWVLGSIIGAVAADTLIDEQGVAIKNVNARASATSWDGTDLFISNKSAVIQLNSDNAASKNWLIANVSGELVVVDVGTTEFPDARSIAVTQPLTHRVFHEGHPPTQSEVAGTVPEAPLDSTYYTRRNGAWSPMPQSITGNAATATKLQTARLIGGVSFNGTASINLPGVNTAGNQNTSGNAATATRLQTARQIGGVFFNGTANINLPGVNTAGNQNTSGNAATATKLQTARLIGGVSFNGSANINLPGVNIAGNQNTSGNAATATTATNVSGGTVAGIFNISNTGTAIAGMSYGAIGTYAFMYYGGSSGTLYADATLAGSSLIYGSTNNNGGIAGTGTWRCMGHANGNSSTDWLRIS